MYKFLFYVKLNDVENVGIVLIKNVLLSEKHLFNYFIMCTLYFNNYAFPIRNQNKL